MYKLQNVLINASNVTEKSTKNSENEKKIKSAKPILPQAFTPAAPVPKVRPASNLTESKSSSSSKPKYIPAHRIAPFRTDPNLHRLKSNKVTK